MNSLVAIGALKQARVLLLRLPRLPEIYPDIAEHMCKLLHVIIEPVYAPLSPTKNFPAPTKTMEDEADLYPSMPQFKHSKVDGVMRGRKSAHPKYAFFYHLWRDKGLPSCTDLNQALNLLKKLLIFVGPNLHRDVKLMWKIIRIGVTHLTEVTYFFHES